MATDWIIKNWDNVAEGKSLKLYGIDIKFIKHSSPDFLFPPGFIGMIYPIWGERESESCAKVQKWLLYEKKKKKKKKKKRKRKKKKILSTVPYPRDIRKSWGAVWASELDGN